MSIRQLLTVTAAAAGATMALVACGSGAAHSLHAVSGMTMTGMPSTTSAAAGRVAATGPHNHADVTFVSDMIPHHTQAVRMAEMALSRATDPRVKVVAEQIKLAQDPEITQMTGWLTGWGQPVPGSSTNMGGMPHGAGMMSDADLATLGHATGHAFDRTWVQMMITHHQGAITMASIEHAGGQNPAVLTLAQSISTSQTAQVDQLRRLLTQLPTA